MRVTKEEVRDFIDGREEELREDYEKSDYDGTFSEFCKREYEREKDMIKTRSSNFRPF